MEWTVHGSRSLYDSPWVALALVDVEVPGGPRFDHHVVRSPRPAVGCVVHDDDRGVLLLWRHRFITGTWGWEVPAGGVDDGESLERAAAREVLEETGWSPGPLRRLHGYHPSNGLSDQRFELFARAARRTSELPPTRRSRPRWSGCRPRRSVSWCGGARCRTDCPSPRCCGGWPSSSDGNRPARPPMRHPSRPRG